MSSPQPTNRFHVYHSTAGINDHVYFNDRPCTDDLCHREHRYVLTHDEYVDLIAGRDGDNS